MPANRHGTYKKGLIFMKKGKEKVAAIFERPSNCLECPCSIELFDGELYCQMLCYTVPSPSIGLIPDGCPLQILEEE